MKKLQEPMEFPTFFSLLAALEENYELLRAADYSVKERNQRIKENIQIMEDIIQQLDETAIYPDEEIETRKAA